MQVHSDSRRIFQLAISLLLLGTLSPATAQSVADNIRPVSSVCLAGQACVGTAAEGAATAATATAISVPSPAPTTSAPASAVSTPASPAAAVSSTPAAPQPPAEAETSAASDFDAAAVYQQSCFACHATGAAGAPVLGDAEAWEARMEKGMDTVMSNVINGMNAMPAKGLCIDCSDDDLRAIVDYMLEQ